MTGGGMREVVLKTLHVPVVTRTFFKRREDKRQFENYLYLFCNNEAISSFFV